MRKKNGGGQLNAWLQLDTIKLVDRMIELQRKATGIEPSRSQIVELAIRELAEKQKVAK